MRISGWAKIAGFFTLALVFLSAGLALAQQGRIGVAATVQNQVFGNSQPLSSGSSIFANERIRTGEASRLSNEFVGGAEVRARARALRLRSRSPQGQRRGADRPRRVSLGFGFAGSDELSDQNAGRDHRRTRHCV